jgi:hypothetical protein
MNPSSASLLRIPALLLYKDEEEISRKHLPGITVVVVKELPGANKRIISFSLLLALS